MCSIEVGKHEIEITKGKEKYWTRTGVRRDKEKEKKDEGESQRLAGYGSLNQGYQDIVVRQEEVTKAKAIIDKVQKEL